MECVRKDDHRVVEWGGEPEVVDVVGDTGKGDEPTLDDCKVSSWSSKVTTDYFVFSPHPSNDFWGKSLRAK